MLGWLWFHLVRVRRRVALENLAAAFPELAPGERRRLAARCFRHLAACGVEFLRMPRLLAGRAEDLFEVQGMEHLRRALEAGAGVLVVTGHLGNFDLLACAAARWWLNELHVVTRSQHVGWINRYWMESRARCGLKLLPEKDSALHLDRLLRKGGSAALLIDQHLPHGPPHIFFGRPAATTRAPALLAFQTGAALVPVWSERLARDRHRLWIDPPLWADRTGERSGEVARLTDLLNGWLEERVRRRPEQWLWIHRRWKI